MSEQPGGDGIYDAADAMHAFVERARSTETKFPLGYSMDHKCGVMRAGELALMWARSGTGKSSWMLNVVARTTSIPTAVINMEMPPAEQIRWLLCMVNHLPMHSDEVEEIVHQGVEGDYPELVEAMDSMQRVVSRLTFVQPPKKPTVTDIIRTCDAIWERKGVRPLRVFIDHLTLMRGCNGSKEAIEAVTSELHSWAQRDGIAVIAIQQTGRAGDGSGARNDGHIPATLSSGVYGGESDADYVYGLYQPQLDPKYATEEARDTAQFARIKGVTRFQLIKNRPYGKLMPVGLELHYESHSRRLMESGERWTPPVEHGGSDDEVD